MSDNAASRFIRIDDPHAERFVYNLPRVWWSRSYEYAWAASFAQAEDVALDAACGVCHPLKFYLSDSCRQVDACDADPRILSPDAIRAEVAEVAGAQTAADLPERYLRQIRYAQASLLDLPYATASVDKIYCISVLEHLKDSFNGRSSRDSWFVLARHWLPCHIHEALREFRRVLKPGGLVVLTFDYPRIDLGYFARVARRLGLRFAGPASSEIPHDALYSREYDLYCYRALLRKSTNQAEHEGRPADAHTAA